MGRLGRPDPGHQEPDRHRRAVRQQELRPGHRADAGREGAPGGRRGLPGHHLGLPGQGEGPGRRLQAQALGRHPGRHEGPGWRVLLDPLRHAGLLRQQGRAGRQAGAALVEGPAQARVQGHGRLPRPEQRLRRLCRRRGGQPGAGRHARQLRPGHRLVQAAQEERADRAQADRLRARGGRRDPDPARLRLQRLPRQVQGPRQRGVRDPAGGLDRGAVRDEPGGRRAACGQCEEGARLRALR